MAEYPHMPLATDAYLGDTPHLTTLEHGAYFLLLVIAWRVRGVPCLPNDDVLLARYARLDPRTWRKIKPTIMAFWTLNADGTWTQKKQLKVRELVSKRVAVAKENALKRWGAKPLKDNVPTDAVALPNACQIDANENQTTFGSKNTPNGVLSETVVSDPVKPRKRNGYSAEFEADWRAYPTDSNMSKLKAFNAWSKLSAEDRAKVAAAIPAFVAFCRKDPTYRPVHMVRFITERRFDGFAEMDAPRLGTTEDWVKRLKYGRDLRTWSTPQWGPMPGLPGCKVPPDLLAAGDGAGWSEHELRVAS